MIIIGSFRHSIELEQALYKLERLGIPRQQLLVVCMDSEPKDLGVDKKKAEETYSKGFEIGIACATALSVIGTIVGFAMPWGPIIAGLCAGIIGFLIGFGIVVILHRQIRPPSHRSAEVTVIVQCNAEQSEQVQQLLWSNQSLAVGLAYASME